MRSPVKLENFILILFLFIIYFLKLIMQTYNALKTFQLWAIHGRPFQ